MATMNISLPDVLRDWVEEQTQTGKYANNSDYVRDLIRRDQERVEKLRLLQQAINNGLESGTPSQLDMEAIKQKARKQAGIA